MDSNRLEQLIESSENLFLVGEVTAVDDPPSPKGFYIPSDISITTEVKHGLGAPYQDYTPSIPYKKLMADSDCIRNTFPLFRFFKRILKEKEMIPRIETHIKKIVFDFFNDNNKFTEGCYLCDIDILGTKYGVNLANLSKSDVNRKVSVGSYHVDDYGSLEGIGWGAHNHSEYTDSLSGAVKGTEYRFVLRFQRRQV